MNLAIIAYVVLALAILTASGLVFHRIWADLRVEGRRGLNRPVAARIKDGTIRKGEVLAGTHDLSLILIFAAAYLASPLLNLDPLFAATAMYVAANALVFVVSRNFEQGMFMVAWVSRLTIVAMGSLTLWWQDEANSHAFCRLRLHFPGGGQRDSLAQFFDRFLGSLSDLGMGPCGGGHFAPGYAGVQATRTRRVSRRRGFPMRGSYL